MSNACDFYLTVQYIISPNETCYDIHGVGFGSSWMTMELDK
jgi:hypothetical protein